VTGGKRKMGFRRTSEAYGADDTFFLVRRYVKVRICM